MRQRCDEVFLAHRSEPDRHDVRPDRHVAVDPALGKVIGSTERGGPAKAWPPRSELSRPRDLRGGGRHYFTSMPHSAAMAFIWATVRVNCPKPPVAARMSRSGLPSSERTKLWICSSSG